MIDYVVHGNKWIFNYFFYGAGLVIIFILTCWAMWRPREEEKAVTGQKIKGIRSFLSWLLGVAPWAIILTILGTAVYSVVHTLSAMITPPNW